jgi:hypothetical protein
MKSLEEIREKISHLESLIDESKSMIDKIDEKIKINPLDSTAEREKRVWLNTFANLNSQWNILKWVINE